MTVLASLDAGAVRPPSSVASEAPTAIRLDTERIGMISVAGSSPATARRQSSPRQVSDADPARDRVAGEASA